MSDKCWLLTKGSYSDYTVIGVYTNYDNAVEAHAEYMKVSPYDLNPLQIMTLNKPVKSALPRWSAKIELKTGEITPGQVWEFPNDEYSVLTSDYPHWKTSYRLSRDHMREYYEVNGLMEKFSTVYSDQSQEHANKLAVEERQLVLRTVDVHTYPYENSIGMLSREKTRRPHSVGVSG